MNPIISHHRPFAMGPRPQQGVTLVTALFFLVILTLLGLAAVRSGNLGLRLADNEAMRLDAVENAQTAINSITLSSVNLAVLPSSGYTQGCVIGTALNATTLAAQEDGFACPASYPTGAATLTVPGVNYAGYLYMSIYRNTVNGADFVPVSAEREGDSGDRYSLASFTITAGYDHVATSDTTAVAQGGAEISQGVYVKVAKVRGLTQQ